MGDFDDTIAWLKERVKIAKEDLQEFVAGRRQFRDDVDITDLLIKRANDDILRFEILIAAYESHNA